MKKVLLISNMYPSMEFPSYGVFVKNFANNLKKNGINYEKIVMYKTNNKFIKLFRYFYFFTKTFFSVLFKKYDIIYIHYPSISAIPILKITRIKKLNIFTNIHGTDADPVTSKEIRLEKNTQKISKLSKKIIVPSQYFKELVVNKYNIDGNKVIVYPSGGVDTNVFYPMDGHRIQELKKNIVKNINKKIVGFVSRIEDSKGWINFIEAINLLRHEEDFDNYQFIIIGSGKDDIKLQNLIDEYNLNEYIIRKNLVSQEDLNKYFNLFDLFVFPTKKESLGLVAIEAMSTRTIVISSDIPPLNEYIITNQTGFLVEKDKSVELSQMIKRVNSLDKVTLEKIETKAYKISQKYNKNNVNRLFRKIFDLD